MMRIVNHIIIGNIDQIRDQSLSKAMKKIDLNLRDKM